jgi:hypothetical protein
MKTAAGLPSSAHLGLEHPDGTTLAVFVGRQVVDGQRRQLGERVDGGAQAVALQGVLAAFAQRTSLVV